MHLTSGVPPPQSHRFLFAISHWLYASALPRSVFVRLFLPSGFTVLSARFGIGNPLLMLHLKVGVKALHFFWCVNNFYRARLLQYITRFGLAVDESVFPTAIQSENVGLILSTCGHS